MNTKAEHAVTGTTARDIAKYALALLIAVGGIVVFYGLPQWPAPVRGLLVVVGFVAAMAVLALTNIGHRGRDFLSESLFELRKVVWPTRQEAMRITGVVLLVVAVISLILAGFDFLISLAVKWLLSN